MKIKPWDATNRPVHRSARRSALSTSYLTRPKGRFTSSTTKQRLRRLQARRCASSVPWKTICSRLQASTLVRQSKRPASRPTLYAGGSALSTCVPWLVKALSRKSNLLEARKRAWRGNAQIHSRNHCYADGARSGWAGCGELGLDANQRGCDSASARTPRGRRGAGCFYGAPCNASKQSDSANRQELDRRYEGLHHELFHVSRNTRQSA